MTVKFDDLKKEWMKESGFKEAYDALEPEYQVALELIKARVQAGLSQEVLAEKMGTTQSVIARLESGRQMPSLKTLYKFAKATNSSVEVRLNH